MKYVSAADAPPTKTGDVKIYDAAAFEGMRKAGHVAAACLDEFGHTLFVFTRGDAKLYVFKYEADLPSIVMKKKEVDLSDQDPYISEAHVVSMDYVQELQGVVITFATGGIYLYKTQLGDGD